MSDDYGYINARMKAMKSRLLKRVEYDRMLGLETIEEVVSFLDATPYGRDVELALTLKKGMTGVDEGFRRNLEKTFNQIISMTSDRPRELVHIVMGRWELLNIKTILRGKHINATLDTILANLVPFGRLDDVALRELANQKNVKSVIDLLSQWRIPYASALREAFLTYRDKEDLQILELALDRAYFSTALRSLDPSDPDDGQIIDFLKREIDMVLVSYAIRMVHYGLREFDESSVFIPWGKNVNAEKFSRMIKAKDMDDLIKVIDMPGAAECFEAGMVRYLENHRLSFMERALETCFIRHTCGTITRDPLSIVVVIAYLWLKVNEIMNLRVISRGKYTTMPNSEIEKNLVFV